MPDHRERASAIKARAAKQFADLTLEGYTPDELKRRMAAAYLEYEGQLSALRAEHKVDERGRSDQLKRQVYGADDLRPAGADPVAFRVSYRDAEDRAASLENQNRGLILLERALSSGDDLLARAIAAEATRRKWADVLETYCERYPDYERKVDDARNSSMSVGIGAAVVFGLQKPAELRGMSHDLISIAATTPAAAAPRPRFGI